MMDKTDSYRLVFRCFALAFVWLASSVLIPVEILAEDGVDAGKSKTTQAENASSNEQSTSQAELDEIKYHARSLSRAFRNAASSASPSVVTILSYGQNMPANQQEAEASEEEQSEAGKSQLTGLGSGVIVSSEGMVITNNHVIRGAKRVVIQLSDETEIEATHTRGDADSDVATLRISRDEPFEFAPLGDSDLVEIGDWVLAIGSPFRLEATVSAGIISAKNRSLQRINRGRLIQTDAAINPGNSGGPLINLDGEVIGISTAIATRNGGYQGIGFVIPINHAKWIADELDQRGSVRRAAIGVTMAELNPRIASRFNLPARLGVLAYQIIEDSAAERAGIRPLDVITEFAGDRYIDPGNLREAIERMPVGSRQKIKVYRKGEEIEFEIELASVEDPTLQSE
ncbi:MAG: trypsin-like peptidase domain-containing protein [Planctomycetota bacterium]